MRRYAGARAWVFSGSEGAVLDVIYIACTIAFFALMLAFVRGLESLGRDPALQDEERP
jgi:hypothetical protein